MDVPGWVFFIDTLAVFRHAKEGCVHFWRLQKHKDLMKTVTGCSWQVVLILRTGTTFKEASEE